MTQLTYQSVEDTFDWLTSIEDDTEIDQLIDQFGEKQPFVFSFLLSIGEEDFNDDEQEIFLYQGVFVWQVFERNFTVQGPVSDNELEAVRSVNLSFIEDIELASKPAEKEAIARGIIHKSDHPELLNYLIELLNEESDFLRPANKWMIFAFLKVLMDSFNLFSGK